jgi:hypothetical protein
VSFCPKILKIKCCDLIFSTADLNTNEHLTVYKNNPTKNKYRGQRVWREYTVILDCPKKHCKVAEVHRYNDKFQKIHRFRLTGANYYEHIARIEKSKQKITFRPVLREKPYSRKFELRYNKPMSDTKGQKRYLNESGYDEIYEADCIIYQE